jgi:hypothetical protein
MPMLRIKLGHCRSCRQPFKPKRRDARYCSAACKQMAYRWRHIDDWEDPDEDAPAQDPTARAKWQIERAYELADEFALPEGPVSRRMLTRVRAVAKRWRKLAADLRLSRPPA